MEFGGYSNFTKNGALIAGLMPKMEPSSPDVWSPYICVADAQATVDLAAASSATVFVPPMAVGELGTMVTIADPGGAVIGMWQPGEHKGFGFTDEPGSPSWVELHTRDYERSTVFYSNVFGWDLAVQGDTPEFRYSVATGAQQIIGLMDASAWLPAEVPSHWSIYWETADCDATLAQIVALGGAVVAAAETTPYGVLATAADPMGAVFKLRKSPAS